MNIYTAIDAARENELEAKRAKKADMEVFWRSRRIALQDIVDGKITLAVSAEKTMQA